MSIWKFDRVAHERVERLVSPPDALGLIEDLFKQSNAAFSQGRTTVKWEKFSSQKAHRAWVNIPVEKIFFDKFFNGKYGYRAQFYHSANIGNGYNRIAVEKLENTLLDIFEKTTGSLEEVNLDGDKTGSTVSVDEKLFKCSILGSESKIWLPFGAFELQSNGFLDIPRWRRDGNLKGVKIPLPDDMFVDFKGTFISDKTNTEIANKPLRQRSEQIHKSGYT